MDRIYGKEQRGNIRYTERLNVFIDKRKRKSKEKMSGKGLIRNLGPEGMLFLYDKELGNYCKFNAVIELSEPYRDISVRAVVVWKKPQDDKTLYGAEFDKISKEDLDVLNKYLNRPTATRSFKLLFDRRKGVKDRRKQ